MVAAIRPKLPSYKQLEEAYRERRATMPVDRINHREFVMDGVRYFAGWDSSRSPKPPNPADYPGAQPWNIPEYKVVGWIVYKSRVETLADIS